MMSSLSAIVAMTLAPIHMFVQYVIDLRPQLKTVFKYRGDVPNRITSVVFNTWLVAMASKNLYTSTINNEWFVLSQYSIDASQYITGFFAYDLLFMLQSSSRKYYIGFIVHHIISMATITMICRHNGGNNIAINTIYILLETPTPFLNLYKISGYMYPNAPGTKRLQRITKSVYFTSRIVLFAVWICVTPFTLNNPLWLTFVSYTVFVMVYVASYKWYKMIG